MQNNSLINDASYLHWDSVFFGYSIAKVQNNEINDQELSIFINDLFKKNYKLVYFFDESMSRVSTQDLSDLNGKLVDTKVIYSKLLVNGNRFINSSNYESYLHHASNQRLLSLALQSGKHSRYYTDANFKKNEYIKLYSTWLHKSLEGSIADEIYIHKCGTKEVGLITLKLNKKIAEIGLLSVDVNYRRKHIASNLMSGVINFASSRNCRSIEVATQQSNLEACGFYEKQGFSKIKVINIYHFWNQNNEKNSI